MRPSSKVSILVLLGVALAGAPPASADAQPPTSEGVVPAGAGHPHHVRPPGDSLAIGVPGLAVPTHPAEAFAREASPPRPGRGPNLLHDGGLLLGGTTAYALARDKHRGFILAKGSVDNVLANFRHPVRRALAGSDEDSFLTNYVAHPLTWGGIALYLKHQGYSDHGAFALSQAHSVFWEYVVEGSYTTPSGRDMVTNFFSAAFVVYGLPLITGDLFGAPGPDADLWSPASGLTLTLAPRLTSGPWGPTVQLAFELR
jgi:hypothetical protein